MAGSKSNKNTKSKGRGKGGKAKSSRNDKKERPISTSTRAGLSLPVPRTKKHMVDQRLAGRISKTAPIYLTAVLEYLVAEVLELAGNAAKDNKKKTINPRHVMLAIRMDDELGKLCSKVWFPHAGSVENLHPILAKKSKKKYKKKKAVSDDESQNY